VAAGGRSVFRPVQKGIAGDMYIEIASGLKQKEDVITGPFAMLKKLQDGDNVRLSRNKK
jgi:hypothetical protein